MSLYTLAITTPASLSPSILEGVGFNSPVMEKAITNGSGTDHVPFVAKEKQVVLARTRTGKTRAVVAHPRRASARCCIHVPCSRGGSPGREESRAPP